MILKGSFNQVIKQIEELLKMGIVTVGDLEKLLKE